MRLDEADVARAQADKKSIRVGPPAAAPRPPPVAPPSAPAVPLRARCANVFAALRARFAAIPWQVWRTLAGLVVLVLLAFGIARACAKSKSAAPPAPAATTPLTDPCRPAPEPYLD